MKLHSFTVGPFAENTYVLIDEDQAVLIDPGFSNDDEFGTFRRKLDQSSAELQAVLLTHAHVDHVFGLHRVLENYDVPVYLNDADRYLWNNFASQAKMFGFEAQDFDFKPNNLPAQKNWSVGPFHFDVFYTPGHAPDHVSLFNADEQWVIVGDALFKQGIGRTDLFKGSMDTLKKSIREHLYTLPDDITVYPGHGPATTIGQEKSENPFVKG